MSNANPWGGLLTLALIPFYVVIGVWVLFPCWLIGGLFRYCFASAKVRERRWQIDHSSRTRALEQYERDTVELLRRRGLLDTRENRGLIRR